MWLARYSTPLGLLPHTSSKHLSTRSFDLPFFLRLVTFNGALLSYAETDTPATAQSASNLRRSWPGPLVTRADSHTCLHIYRAVALRNASSWHPARLLFNAVCSSTASPKAEILFWISLNSKASTFGNLGLCTSVPIALESGQVREGTSYLKHLRTARTPRYSRFHARKTRSDSWRSRPSYRFSPSVRRSRG